MDPDEALKNAREALRLIRDKEQEGYRDWGGRHEAQEFVDLADAFEALDGWLSKGGFLPKAWNKKRR